MTNKARQKRVAELVAALGLPPTVLRPDEDLVVLTYEQMESIRDSIDWA